MTIDKHAYRFTFVALLVALAGCTGSEGCRPLCNLAASAPPAGTAKMKCNSTNGQTDTNGADGWRCGIDKMASGASATFYNSSNVAIGSCTPPGGSCNDTGTHPCN